MRALVVLLIVPLLAGCLDGDQDEPEPAAAALPLASPEEVGVRSGEGGNKTDGTEGPDGKPARNGSEVQLDHAIEAAPPIEGGTMLASISADAPVAGYTFTFANDAAHPYWEGSSFERIALSMAPVFEEAPEALIVSFHDLDDGHLMYSYWMVPFEGTLWLTAALPTDLGQDAHLEPTTAWLSEDLEGRTIGVVIAGQGVQGPTGVLLRVDDELEVSDDPRSVEDLEAHGVWAPIAIGTAPGASHGLVQEIHLGLYAPVGLLGLELYAGDQLVEDRMDTWVPPHGGARDATFKTTAGGDWGYTLMAHLAGEGVSDWNYQASVAGLDHADDGLLVWGNGYGYLGSALVFGLPLALGEGDGGGSSVQTDITTASTNAVFLMLSLSLAYEAPLADLLDTPAKADLYAFDGVLGIDRERDALDIADATFQVAGLDL